MNETRTEFNFSPKCLLSWAHATVLHKLSTLHRLQFRRKWTETILMTLFCHFNDWYLLWIKRRRKMPTMPFRLKEKICMSRIDGTPAHSTRERNEREKRMKIIIAFTCTPNRFHFNRFHSHRLMKNEYETVQTSMASTEIIFSAKWKIGEICCIDGYYICIVCSISIKRWIFYIIPQYKFTLDSESINNENVILPMLTFWWVYKLALIWDNGRKMISYSFIRHEDGVKQDGIYCKRSK